MAEVVAIIPARGGSKGIPGKNLARVGGIPLVVRSVRHARSAARIDRVVVTTDDDGIAEAARRAGAEIVRRPARLAGDEASTESAVAHALAELDTRDVAVSTVVLMQCTSPFRSDGQLDAAVEAFEHSRADALFAAVPFCGFVWTTGPDGAARPATYDPVRRPRRQEIDGVFLETGSFYVFSRATFEATGSRMGGRVEAFAVPEEDALEIDTPEDLWLARTLAARRREPGPLVGVEPALLVLDVDGTLTDAAMYYGETGEELKRFDTRDGAGIARFRAHGGKVALLTGERSNAARLRGQKLRVDDIVLGSRDKARDLAEIQARLGVPPERTIAMGDDVLDLPMRTRAAAFVAPADAHPEVLGHADLVTRARGGRGAVRELVDGLLGPGWKP